MENIEDVVHWLETFASSSAPEAVKSAAMLVLQEQKARTERGRADRRKISKESLTQLFAEEGEVTADELIAMAKRCGVKVIPGPLDPIAPMERVRMVEFISASQFNKILKQGWSIAKWHLINGNLHAEMEAPKLNG